MGCKDILYTCSISPADFRRRSKNKTAEQKKVLKYFTTSGLIPMFTNLKDEEYDALVKQMRDSLNIQQKALAKMGLDPEQVNEIPPITIEGYDYRGIEGGSIDCWKKFGKDGVARSSAYSVTQLYFSDTGVHAYQIIFSTDDNTRKERTEEYHWRHVTNFSTASDTVNVSDFAGCLGMKVVDRNNETRTFSIIVPGDKFTCSTSQDIDRQVSAMKAKLREKMQV